jgi:hypothetical protein
MKQRFAVSALVVLAMAAFGTTQAFAVGSETAQASKKSKKKPKSKVFEVCLHGCKYRTVQKGVDAAGGFKAKKKNSKVKAYVKIKPGKYVEGVVLDGTKKKKDYDGLTIMGTKSNPRKTILEGKNAKGELGPAQNGVEAISVSGVVLKNMWARNYESNGFFVHADTGSGQRCVGYTMNNLLASGNRSYGLFAKGCFGGKMINSAGFHQGDSAFYVGETPCEKSDFTVHGLEPRACQKTPQWTTLRNDESYENVLGYSGTNSKYVRIVESDFFNNGAGIVPNTLDSEGFEPNGWNVFEKNNVFWNNYNYFLAASSFKTVSNGLGKVGSSTVNYPTGVGIVLYGGDGNVVKQNKVFGNDKWGIASFSGPGEVFVANEGDDAKNVNNQILENSMGRDGADPNGEFDFWNDATGGGNCWGGNTAGASFAPGNGTTPLAKIYPSCPQAPVEYDRVSSLNLGAGLQINLINESDPKTILGYAGTNPPQNQQCSWVRRVAEHPAFEQFKPVEVAAAPGEVTCK